MNMTNVFAHNLPVCEHSFLIYVKRMVVFMQNLVVIHCGMEKSPYLCIVKKKQRHLQ